MQTTIINIGRTSPRLTKVSTAEVVQGVKFKNGIEVTEMPAHHAA